MNNFDPISSANAWIAAWNQRDLEGLLPHYANDVTFLSPIAAQVVGQAVIRGRASLKAYWEKALAERASLHFTLQHVLWDDTTQLLCLLYDSVIDGKRTMVSECQWFGTDGLIGKSAAYYGPDLTHEPASA